METLRKSPQECKPKTLIEVLEFCKAQDLPARIVGRWIWIRFDSKPSSQIRHALKDNGFRWSKRRRQWAHNCGHVSRPARSYRPWDKYQTISLDDAFDNPGSGVEL